MEGGELGWAVELIVLGMIVENAYARCESAADREVASLLDGLNPEDFSHKQARKVITALKSAGKDSDAKRKVMEDFLCTVGAQRGPGEAVLGDYPTRELILRQLKLDGQLNWVFGQLMNLRARTCESSGRKREFMDKAMKFAEELQARLSSDST